MIWGGLIRVVHLLWEPVMTFSELLTRLYSQFPKDLLFFFAFFKPGHEKDNLSETFIAVIVIAAGGVIFITVVSVVTRKKMKGKDYVNVLSLVKGLMKNPDC